MEIGWDDPRCIICVREACMTKAHVIPSAVGGELVVAFECEDCNRQLGRTIEAGLKRDPCVLVAIEAIADRVPRLASRMPFLALDGDVRVGGHWSKDRFRVQDTPQPDQSIVKGPGRARADIETSLRRAGASNEEIAQSVAIHDAAPVDEIIPLGRGLTIRKGQVARFEPDLARAERVDDKCLLAIAYRFLAIAIGTTVYSPALEGIRAALSGRDGDADWKVEWLIARRPYEPWHCLAIRQLEPQAVVEIRLFGQIAWDVTFTTIALARTPRTSTYEIQLEDTTHERLR